MCCLRDDLVCVCLVPQSVLSTGWLVCVCLVPPSVLSTGWLVCVCLVPQSVLSMGWRRLLVKRSRSSASLAWRLLSSVRQLSTQACASFPWTGNAPSSLHTHTLHPHHSHQHQHHCDLLWLCGCYYTTSAATTVVTADATAAHCCYLGSALSRQLETSSKSGFKRLFHMEIGRERSWMKWCYNRSGLSPGWSPTRVVFHQGGLPPG